MPSLQFVRKQARKSEGIDFGPEVDYNNFRCKNDINVNNCNRTTLILIKYDHEYKRFSYSNNPDIYCNTPVPLDSNRGKLSIS